MDYDSYKPGEVIVIDAFFDNKLYKFRVRYVGRENLKTKFGRVRSIVISPVMPSNGLFDGENSIRLWMSDDKNRIPLKVSAELFVGAVELDLKGYDGTRSNLVTQRE